MSSELARAIAEAAHDAGGRALIVGGWPRDRLLGHPSKDIDIEVFGLEAARLRALLESMTREEFCGRVVQVAAAALRS